MSAHEALSPQQFTTHTAAELIQHWAPGDLNRTAGESVADFWARKQEQAQGPYRIGITRGIQARGVEEPVLVDHPDSPSPRIRDGHHRIATAYAMGPETPVPVTYETAGKQEGS